MFYKEGLVIIIKVVYVNQFTVTFRNLLVFLL